MGFIKRHPILIVVVLLVGGYIFWNYFRPVKINGNINKNSEHYVNDMYYADGLRYNRLLSAPEKKMYMDLLADLKKNNIETKLDGVNYGCDVYTTSCYEMLVKVLDAMLIDHPELIQWGNFSTIQVGEFLKVDYKYKIKGSIMKSINTMRILRIIDDIKGSTSKMSEIDKVKYVYEWVQRSDYDTKIKEGSKNNSAYDIFYKNDGHSDSFAKASQIIFQNIGIESYLVNGKMVNDHMWNIVKIDEKYYYFDATLGAGLSEKSAGFYAGVGTNPKNYTLNHPELLPKIDGDKYLFNAQ